MVSTEKKAPSKILVLKGGVSSEREVSLESGKAVADALREAGYEVREYDIQELAVTPEMKEWADVVWPVLHGGYGEDGRIQKMLEDAGIRFVGSGSAACALIMDKVASKKLMDLHGIPNAGYAVLTEPSETIPEGMKLPLIVKPSNEGSTFGITLVETPEDWKKAMELVFRYGNRALVEEFFKGVETTVGIIDGKALPVIEIRYEGKIYDYDAKYTHASGDTEYLCPPRNLPEELQKRMPEGKIVPSFILQTSPFSLRLPESVECLNGEVLYAVELQDLQRDSLAIDFSDSPATVFVQNSRFRALSVLARQLDLVSGSVDHLYLNLDELCSFEVKTDSFRIDTEYLSGSKTVDCQVNPQECRRILWNPLSEKAKLNLKMKNPSEILLRE